MRRFFLAFFVLGLLAWGLPASAQQECFGPSCPGGGGGTTAISGGGTGSTTGEGLVDTCTDSVGTDSYACSNSTTCPASLAASRPVLFTAGTTNTGGATFAFCGLTAKDIVKTVGGISTALATGDILAKQPVLVRYNATDDNWKMISAVSNGPTPFSASVASGPTYCADAGASDAYACDLSVAPASYNAVKGVPLTFTANTVNTGAATISFNSLGAQAIVKVGATTTTALQTNDIRAGSLVTVVWDGTNFQCLSCDGNYANLAIANTWTQGQTINVSSGNALTVQISGTTMFQVNSSGEMLGGGSTPKWAVFTSGANNDWQLGLGRISFGSAYNVTDSGFQRLAAGVIGATLGTTTVGGWIQNSGGEIALNAAYTNATTTFSNTALSVTLISGRAYNFTVNLILSDSTAADGVKIDFNGGTAAMTVFNVSCMMTNDTTGATVAFTAATAAALATTINAATMASTGNHMLVCNGGMVPSGNGTFILRAAQNAHTTGTLTITRGSWMSVRDARPL